MTWKRRLVYVLLLVGVIFVSVFVYNNRLSELDIESGFSHESIVDSMYVDVNHHSLRQTIHVDRDNFSGIRVHSDVVKNKHAYSSWVEVYFKVSLYDGDELVDSYKYEKLFTDSDRAGHFDFEIEPIANSAGKDYELVIEPYYDYDRIVEFSLIDMDIGESTAKIDGEESGYSIAYEIIYRRNHLTFYLLFVFILLVAQFIAIWLLSKNKKIEIKYAIIAITVGTTCAIIMPTYYWHDELFHYTRVYDIVNGHIIPETDDGWPVAYIPNKDLYLGFNRYEQVHEKFLDEEKANELEEFDQEFSGVYSPISYIPSIIALAFAKAIMPDTAIYWTYIMRVVQLLCCVLIVYFAIKKTPIFKRTFAIVALIPAFLCATSFMSPDGILFSFLLLLFAQIFEIMKSRKKISKKQFLVLLASSVVVSITKLVYFPFVFAMLLIPFSRKMRGDKARIISIIILSFAITFVWNVFAVALLSGGQGVNMWYIISYYLKRPFELLQIMVYSFFKYGGNHINDLSALGDDAFMANIYDGTIVPVLFTFVIALTFFNEKSQLNKKSKIILGLILLATFGLISLSLLVACTPVRFTEIMGIQGRYFLPFIPVLAFIFANKKNNISEKVYEYLPEIILLIYFIYEMRIVINTL